MSGITLLLSALPFESELIEALLKEKGTNEGVSGYLGKRSIRVVTSGVGGRQCTSTLNVLLDDYPDAEVLFLGTAGALNSLVTIGDVVVANTPVCWESVENEKIRKIFGAACFSHSSGVKRGNNYSFTVFPGKIATWDEPLMDKTVKSWLFDISGAHCVDMETGYGAHLCENRGVPFLAVRGISDTADENGGYSPVQAVWNATVVALEALLSEGSLSTWPEKLIQSVP